jgi:hypothetical protein
MTKTPLTVTAEQIQAATDRGVDVTRMMENAATSAIADEEGRKLAQLAASAVTAPVRRTVRMTASELLRQGGEWLGAARSWMQRQARNGERVTWGSDDVLETSLSVRDVEELAADVAAAAMREQPIEERVDHLLRARWTAEQQRDRALAEVERAFQHGVEIGARTAFVRFHAPHKMTVEQGVAAVVACAPVRTPIQSAPVSVCCGAAPLTYQGTPVRCGECGAEWEPKPTQPVLKGGLTFDQAKAACANMGINLDCGSCAAQFYTGFGGYDHDATCTRAAVAEIHGDLRTCPTCEGQWVLTTDAGIRGETCPYCALTAPEGGK